MYEELGVENKFYVVGSGEIMKEIVEHIVNIHNKTYGGNK
jgi:predicted small metal-binding protein